MKLPMFSLALTRSIVLVGLGSGVAAGAELPRADGNATRKVEFAEVEGRPCLQPVVRSADADLDDFRAAEQRWLSDHFPGRPLPRWQNVLLLPPDTHGDGRYVGATVKSETAYVRAADGSEIEVCFDIGVFAAGTAARD